MTRLPFEAKLAPEELFAGTAMAEAEARLKHLLELRAIGLFTGEAGCELALFEPSAVAAFFQATQGMPRKVNLLAHYALSAAALANARTVTAEHLQAALEDLGP